ncbi:hypothetical protein CCONF_08415 [Corynebacterium confusum]|nr:hypothetical protein CCONF_08415 [Corynebacterium confusum]
MFGCGRLRRMETAQIPIASIFYEKDFRLAILQALSIDRLFEKSGLCEYTVIANGSDDEALREQFLNALGNVVSSEFKSLVRVKTFSEILPGIDKTGYYDQQAIKLAISRYYKERFGEEAPNYLMLDSKNHFVRPSSVEDFFHAGRPVTARVAISPYWKKYVERSRLAVEIPESFFDNLMTPSITPCVFFTDVAVELVDFLEKKYETHLLRALSQSGGTEFLLYVAWLEKQDQLGLYHRSALPVRTLFTQHPDSDSGVEKMLDELVEKGIPLFGLHRNRLPKLSEEHRQRISDIWGRSLLAPWEDSNWFLTPATVN